MEASVQAGATPALPEKIRAHALAKLLGVTSKQVLAEAAALGTELRSAQSSLTREIAERIHATVTGAAAGAEQVTEPAAHRSPPPRQKPPSQEPPSQEPPSQKPPSR